MTLLLIKNINTSTQASGHHNTTNLGDHQHNIYSRAIDITLSFILYRKHFICTLFQYSVHFTLPQIITPNHHLGSSAQISLLNQPWTARNPYHTEQRSKHPQGTLSDQSIMT